MTAYEEQNVTRGGRGGSKKVPKKCHLLFELPPRTFVQPNISLSNEKKTG